MSIRRTAAAPEAKYCLPRWRDLGVPKLVRRAAEASKPAGRNMPIILGQSGPRGPVSALGRRCAQPATFQRPGPACAWARESK